MSSRTAGEAGLVSAQPKASVPRQESDAFLAAVRGGGKISYGEAKAYASSLQQKSVCGCYKITVAKGAACCGGRCVGYTCPIPCCGGCVWTPGFFCFLDALIGLCFCTCKDAQPDNAYSCTDMKGNFYALVRVDDEKGTLAWFSENRSLGGKGDSMTNTCFCVK